MENSIIGRLIVHNLRQRGGCAWDVSGSPPPPSLHYYIGWFQYFCEIFNFVFHEIFLKFREKIKIILSKFCVSNNFDKIILNLAKFEENFANLRERKFRHFSENLIAVPLSNSSAKKNIFSTSFEQKSGIFRYLATVVTSLAYIY